MAQCIITAKNAIILFYNSTHYLCTHITSRIGDSTYIWEKLMVYNARLIYSEGKLVLNRQY